MCDTAHAPTECCYGGRTRRPYVGRYVRPPPREAPIAQTVAHKIEVMFEAARLARYNARVARREGDLEKSSAAYHRVYEYIEAIRDLRAWL